jgi:NTP pyrophosphatase (non-canonical NTP hydrolase)
MWQTPPMTLTDIQTRVDVYISQFKEGYFPPLENMVRLTEEVGELAREVTHLHGHKKKKASEAPGSALEEIGDILFVVACLANQMNLSLEDAFARTMQKYDIRDANRWTRKEIE